MPPRRVRSLQDMCLDALGVNGGMRVTLFGKQALRRDGFDVHLDFNNEREAVVATLSRFNLHSHTILTVGKKHKVTQVQVLADNIHPMTAIRTWTLLRVYHTHARTDFIIHAIKHKLITPSDGVSAQELMCLATSYAAGLTVKWLTRTWHDASVCWFTSRFIRALCTSVCTEARNKNAEAPCMTARQSLDDWCPVCIYRWAEYETQREKWTNCCKGIHPDKWCMSCTQMRRNLPWASLVHLMM